MQTGLERFSERLWVKLRLLNATYDIAPGEEERKQLRFLIDKTYRRIRTLGIVRSPFIGMGERVPDHNR